MGKNLKLNIKNLQLAGALNSKKAISSQKEEAQKKETTSSTEPEPTKRLTRLKDDASISTAIKQAEKTLAAREKEKESEDKKKLEKEQKRKQVREKLKKVVYDSKA